MDDRQGKIWDDALIEADGMPAGYRVTVPAEVLIAVDRMLPKPGTDDNGGTVIAFFIGCLAGSAFMVAYMLYS